MTVSAQARNQPEPANGAQLDLYRIFAFLFGQPSRERFAWLARWDLAAALDELGKELGAAGALGAFRDYEQYEAIYIAVFDVGAPGPPVPLLESAYCPFLPAQEVVLENTSFYEVLGLRVDPTRQSPDHLLTQLEFLAAVRYTRENTPDAANRTSLGRLERDYLERHLLNWLPAAQKKLDREQPPVFPFLLRLLLAFLRQQYDGLSWQAAGETRPLS